MSEVRPVIARLRWRIGFHPKNVNCGGCPLNIDDPGNRGRKRCVLTQEITYDQRSVGMMCPLDFEEDENEGRTSESSAECAV